MKVAGAYAQKANSAYDIIRETEKKGKDWKSQLTGAFNEQQIFLSLVIIGLFYLAYAFVNAFLGNGRDEDFVTRHCHCEDGHRLFYRIWFGICFGLWSILYTFTFFEEVSKHTCPNTVGKILTTIRSWICGCVMYPINQVIRLFCCCCKSIWSCIRNCSCECSKSNDTKDNDNTKKDSVIEAKINQLWFYYYKLYVVGYKRGDDDWTIVLLSTQNVTSEKETQTNELHLTGSMKDGIERQGTDTTLEQRSVQHATIETPSAPQSKEPIQDQPNIVHSEQKGTDTTSKPQSVKHPPTETPIASAPQSEKSIQDQPTSTVSSTSSCDCQCTYICYYMINIFFMAAKYVAQLATVPLILVQMFDTYSLLCFVPNQEYCSATSEYRIHAVQTILTVSFYCSLALSLLANTILDWNPWPRKLTQCCTSIVMYIYVC